MHEPKELLARLDDLKTARKNFDTLFDEVQQLVWPDGATFLTKRSPGEKTHQKIYDATATYALDKFEAAMESFLIPRHLRWHGLRAISDELNEQREVKTFFEFLTKLLFQYRERPSAQFYSQMGENLRSLGAYGTGCLYVDESPTKQGFRYRHIPVSRIWIETNYAGIVDTVYHEYPLTARMAAQKWPDDVPEKAAKALEAGRPGEEQTYLHVVMPNDPEKIDPFSLVPDRHPFIGYDIECQTKSVIMHESMLDEGALESTYGYHELPYIVSRLTVNPNEMWGRSPAMAALPDIKGLQEMMKTLLRSAQKAADPPLLVAHDGRLGRGRRKVRLDSGGLTYGAVDESGRPKIIPLETRARLDIQLEMMEQKRDAIFDAFFVKLFDILNRDRVEMTATEVVERSKEKGQLITPIVGRQQSEMLGPMIEREISILQRQGGIEVPQVLLDPDIGGFETEYDTLATRMQQSDEMAAYQRLLAMFEIQIQQDPLLMEVLRAEDAMRTFGETSGIRATLFRSKDEMAEIRKQQAQEAQQAQMAEQALPVAQAAKTVAEIPTGEEAA